MKRGEVERGNGGQGRDRNRKSARSQGLDNEGLIGSGHS
jgi:hypothetical protein